MSAQSEDFNYPIFLTLKGRLTVVVGAGKVGQRKLQRLLQAGSRVRLIDPCLASSPCADADVESVGRCFEPDDLQSAQLVFACTDSPLVNQQVAAEAARRQILCCRTDQALAGDFAVPAVLSQGSLTIAVSTAGSNPALAVEIRDRLAAEIPDCWGFSLEIMAGIRRKWLTSKIYDQYNQQVLRRFWADQLLPLLELGNMSKVDMLLIETFGVEFSLEQLQVQRSEGI